MTIQIIPTAIPDVTLIEPKKHGDHRGFFSETYNQRDFAPVLGDVTFVQDNHSASGTMGTVRGLHFQTPPFAQAKLIRVLKGAIWDVVVDLRRGSATFGHHVSARLSAENWQQLFVPAGFAHGFCTLEPNTEILYKVTAFYAPECDTGILWNDPDLGIDWPVAEHEATLSDKDRRLPRLSDIRHDLPF